jgi:osmotically-inducible protein OsmY
MAGIFALGLAACGREPPPPPAAKASPPPPPAATADAKADQAREAAAKEAAAKAAAASADAALAAKVKDALGATKGLNAHAIDVTAADGAVMLFGTVDTPALRDKATKIAAGVQGVKSVENKLAIVKGS